VVFDQYFKVEDLSSIVDSFQNGVGAEVSRFLPSAEYMDAYEVIPGMKNAVEALVDPESAPEASSAMEFILEGLHLSNQLNKEVMDKGIVYK
jgi:magnesium chelatase subunit I